MEPCEDEDWFSVVEKEAASKAKKQSMPRNNNNNINRGTATNHNHNHNHCNHYSHSNTSPSADNYFAAQSNLVDNKASNLQPNTQTSNLQSRFLPTLSITNLNLSLSTVAVPSVSQVAQAITSFSARSSPTRAVGLPRNDSNDYSEESQFFPKEEFANTSSSTANISSSGRQSPNRPYYDTFNPPAPSKIATAYPSHSSIISSTTKAVVSSLSFFTSSSSSTPAATTNSHAEYRTPTSSTKIATAYPAQNSLLNTTLNTTKAVVTKLASAVSSSSAKAAGADKPETPHEYGYADVRGGMRDSASTLYERVGTSSSSWSKTNNSWGGFADDQEPVGMYGGAMPVKRGSIGAGGMNATGRQY